LQRPVPMRSAACCCTLVALLVLAPQSPRVLAQAEAPSAAEDVPALTVGPAGTYPARLYATFVVGDLTWDACAPLYLPAGVTKGCPLIRGEPAWVDLGVRWSGPGLLTLYPRGGEWLEASLDEDGGSRSVAVTSRILGAPMPARADGAAEMMGGTALRVRLDLSSVISTLPTGSHRICYGLTVFSDPPVPLHDAGRQCLAFFLFDDSRLAARAERLRREAIDQLAEYRCDDAARTVDALLQVHPHSAAGFRLRGIIGELRRRHEAAIADYGRAIELLRTGSDRLLPAAGYDFRRAATELEEWRQSMIVLLPFSPEMSMLGPPEDSPACREDGAN
jgi:hypothetical protein